MIASRRFPCAVRGRLSTFGDIQKIRVVPRDVQVGLTAAPPAEARPKVALLTNMLAPYRISFYRALGEFVDLTVLVDMLSESNRSWVVDRKQLGFQLIEQRNRVHEHTYQRTDLGFSERASLHLSEKTFSWLRRVRPDVVISLELGLRSFWSLLYGRLHSVPVILMHEGTPHTQGAVPRTRKIWRHLLISDAARFWSNGLESTALLTSYGAVKGRIDEAMTGVDTITLRRQVESLWRRRSELRTSMQLSGTTLLYTGSLSGRKGLPQYLAALSRLASRPTSAVFSVIFVGSGEHAADVARWAASHPAIRCVAPGFLQPAELLPFYVAADWGVLPTLDDNWPLATLEMLIAGLPQLFSVYNGATPELHREGITGVLINPLDEADFDRALQSMLTADAQRVAPDVVAEYVDFYSAAAQARRAARSIQQALANRRPAPK